MRYRIIVYRSRKLQDDFVPFDDTGPDEDGVEAYGTDDVEEAEPEEKMTRAQRRAQKKEMKKQRRANAHLMKIGDQEIDPRDYDPEDIEDMRANAALNTDGFYDILEPIDEGDEKEIKKVDKKKFLLLIPIIGAVVLVLFVAFRFAI
jgi:hypothetical protein